jgi:hypothetical protein
MPVQDEDAGVTANPYGAAFATDVPCSVQPALPSREFDDTGARIVEKTMYDVMFRDNYSLKADDKIVWVDDVSVSHNLYVHGNADQAGRGAAFVVSCEEKA